MSLWAEYEGRADNEQNKSTFFEQAIKGSEILLAALHVDILGIW